MALPPSFAQAGFVNPAFARKRMKLKNGKLLKPLMIGTEGETNTGKSEFMFSCPGPAMALIIDRGIDGMLDNPNPPAWRRDDVAVKVVSIPPNMTANQPIYHEYYTELRKDWYAALQNPDAVTVCIDCDSDFWELQRLGAFGKLTQVFPQTRYTDVYAAKRAMIAKAWDSGKIIIASNKVKDEYETVFGPDGLPVKEQDGSEKRQKTGNKERQGFPDQDYLWGLQIRHLHAPAGVRIHPISKREVPTPPRWGLRILKCKAVPALRGAELWDDKCNFKGLVQLVYPNVPMEEWGL